MKAHEKKIFVFECSACFKKYATPYRITTHWKKDHPGEQIISKSTQLNLEQVKEVEVKSEKSSPPMTANTSQIEP